jgi:phage repressor protein C with HTH and peptisase S24 domain
MEYFWPLLESKIKQTTGSPCAFGGTMEPLLEYYRGNKGGLTRFSIEYKNGKLTPDAFRLADKSLKNISGTIWSQPVKYAGGGNFSVFQYDKKDKTIIVGADIWRELSLTGPWITDATILRWAELTARISKNAIKPSEVIDRLLTVPVPEREVSLAKSLYDSIFEKPCIWTDEPIKNKYAIDHAIPFCLWKNNDLWNLFPTRQEVNSNKSDKLPTNDLVRKRKDLFVFYWENSRNIYPNCFDFEVSKFIGQEVSKLKSGWENILFANFAEAIEITAIQRGVERWQPANSSATGINEAYMHMKSDSKKMLEEKTPYNVGGKSRIAKIVSGGQTGADRGGLDAAIELKIPHGGCCPKRRLAEDGTVPGKYNLTETGSKNYVKRTEKNVVDSSATSIFANGAPTGGSKKTAEFAVKHGKPYICLDTEKPELETTESLIEWTRNLRNSQIVLNVAGSRESKAPGIQKQVTKIVGNLIAEVNETGKTEMEETPAKIAIMYFPDLEVACGAFRTDSSSMDYEGDTIGIENVHGNIDPKRHFVVKATGHSMDGGNAPIRDGDLLLLEWNEGGTVSDQIFAVECQDEFGGTSYVLKRIEKDAPGKYRLVSLNKDYKDMNVNAETMFPFARLKKNLGKIN